MTYRPALAAAARALALPGCGPAAPAPATSPSPGGTVPLTVSPPVVTAARRCDDPDEPSTPVSLVPGGGAALSACEVGSGAKGVLLMPAFGSSSPAHTHPPGVVGVVALSADELTDALAAARYPATAVTAAAALAGPDVFAVAEGAPYVSVVDTEVLVASVPARAKRLIVLPAGRRRGWDLLAADTDGGRPAPNADILAFSATILS